jgi:hypothetical protein
MGIIRLEIHTVGLGVALWAHANRMSEICFRGNLIEFIDHTERISLRGSTFSVPRNSRKGTDGKSGSHESAVQIAKQILGPSPFIARSIDVSLFFKVTNNLHSSFQLRGRIKTAHNRHIYAAVGDVIPHLTGTFHSVWGTVRMRVFDGDI